MAFFDSCLDDGDPAVGVLALVTTPPSPWGVVACEECGRFCDFGDEVAGPRTVVHPDMIVRH